ncbi:class I SAM-dependent methyltransferase [Thauera phenolivorans]|uniref:class I SAM-dependent methyltransferase n=1 Tax=Thauera phenolivorans TaxID=1792543 RepID=UPI0009F5D76A|nr:methyltransferase domain-containing protein [Thauera phenolivorans]
MPHDNVPANPLPPGRPGIAVTPHGGGPPSAWVQRFAPLIRSRGDVLDFACGAGRHARWLAAHGWRVEAVDRDAESLGALAGVPGVQVRQAELEQGAWPYRGRQFDAVVVTNYLFRAHFELLLELVTPGGVLIYETFMAGNERFGKPSNPAFLLAPNELLRRVHDGWTVVAFEQGVIAGERPAAIQRICALKGVGVQFTLPPAA